MAVQPVLRLGDPRLRVRSAELEAADFGSTRLVALVEDLRDTMAAAAGAGLAAPQIGVPLRVVPYGWCSTGWMPIPATRMLRPLRKRCW
jgi:peptide deformylase